MGINSREFLEYVIQPTLKLLGVESESANKLMLATACFQSNLGQHLLQEEAIGIFGISEGLHQEVWDKHIAYDCDLASTVRGMASQHEFPKAPHVELVANLRYATAIAWLIYQYRDLTLPLADDIESLTDCWQRFFLGHPISVKERDEFVDHYRKLHPAESCIAA